jgi:hypothetical protein
VWAFAQTIDTWLQHWDSSTASWPAISKSTEVDLMQLNAVESDVEADVRVHLAKVPAMAGGHGRAASATRLVSTAAGRHRLGSVVAALLGTSVVKTAAHLAFEQKKRSMTASDILQQIGSALSHLEDFH